MVQLKGDVNSAPGKKNIIGILVDPVERASAADMIIAAARERRPFAVSALAVHGVMTGSLDPAHQYRLNRLELVVADGQPVRWALNLLHGAGLRARVYGFDLTLEVLKRAEQLKLPVYFYGSTTEVLEQMRQRVQRMFPEVIIAGTQASAFRQLTPEMADEIAERIRRSGAQIVFSGLGCPRQEVFAYEFRQRLQMPVVAVGAAFPILAGTLRQAPQWMQDSGLEWFFRLCTEPRRLWRRYLLLSPAYLALVLWQLFGFSFSDEGVPPENEILFG
jgi:N-acetylglucosaminyldiphosphoundecaprenol N-acetyl-beta-D-mannosaminyltransferase